MFKRKKKKTGVQTPEFRKPTLPPPPTSGSNAVKPPERAPRTKCNPMDDICDLDINDIIETFKSQQFICSMCGKIVSPEVKVNQNGSLEMTSETGELRGGLGNKVLMDHLCGECMKQISFI